MIRDASTTQPFADDDYEFRMAWGELEKLQEACDAGPYVVLDRLVSGRWRMGDISHTIRLGLIGGGLEPVKALKLVRAYVEARPPLENLVLAQLVLGAGVAGAPEEDVGKKSEAPDLDDPMNSPTGSSDTEPSTATEPSSASARNKSEA
ncbi:gene transfer agent family protein [Mesorhizobium sp. B2-2-4]|uniref:gene transfer agent family protein n=1 Tax=unclassified Mesorhizobium TaxID=325217 RepID=UPI00112BDA0B|nr:MULTISPECIES: gene transfer agent family protein [unclassified Mesorhizobium]TPJ76191.1 gene transfer agent family protein [Mesorhizobium sp. B2-6-3]TPM55350.1 gene transfer agent family protein [Mesorhizobium sp. B2-2-4]TPM66317.1 gene transfer agent family protein [Mesorhizobium sp. B2-2-1]TPN60600.1 gene transfer agent family protein [Mesorhizobium sp. B1-1-3]